MKYQHFRAEEREEIFLGLAYKESIRNIAKRLGRSPSSVSREVKRNLPPERHRYAPRLAEERALKKRSCRGRVLHLKNNHIRAYVAGHLKRRWSPEQIAGRIREDIGEWISHEAIYQYIYAAIHWSGYVKPGREDLRPYLRRRRKRRIPHGARRCQRVKSCGVSIDERPVVVEERTRLGDWEGDTMESKDHKPGINTTVERVSGYVMITKLKDKTSAATTEAIAKRFADLPLSLKQTLTLDNGPEMSDWQTIEANTGLRCYATHPYSFWERGTNENTNGLIRDYFPKKTDFTIIQEELLAFVERELNDRPRKRLGWRTPQEILSVALQG